MQKLWLGLVLVFAACGGTAECVKDSECGSGYECVYKVADGCHALGEVLRLFGDEVHPGAHARLPRH